MKITIQSRYHGSRYHGRPYLDNVWRDWESSHDSEEEALLAISQHFNVDHSALKVEDNGTIVYRINHIPYFSFRLLYNGNLIDWSLGTFEEL